MVAKRRRWPQSTPTAIGAMRARTTDEIPVPPLAVAESVRPSKLFVDLVAATGLPESIVRFIVTDILDDPDVTPEVLTADQLAHVGSTLLRTIDATMADQPGQERLAAHRRLEELLRTIAHRSSTT